MKEINALINKAKESLKAATLLFKENMYDFSASRAYYAMFYTAEAILLTKDLSFSKHSAVISSFGKVFIKSNILPKQLYSYLINAFDLRQKGDYGPFESINKEEAETLLSQAKEFIDKVEEYLKDKGDI